MTDTTVKKVSAAHSPRGDMGQKYLASGKRVSMRLWEAEPTGQEKAPGIRDYETVGYVISGRAELHLEGQTVMLEPGDSWLVPPGAEHSYVIREPFTAVEATTPPAQVHGRDGPAEPGRRARRAEARRARDRDDDRAAPAPIGGSARSAG